MARTAPGAPRRDSVGADIGGRAPGTCSRRRVAWSCPCARIGWVLVANDNSNERFDAKVKRRAALNSIFTPWTPVSTRAAFSGRYDEIMQVTTAVAQPGRHVILYGERGVGKTSL